MPTRFRVVAVALILALAAVAPAPAAGPATARSGSLASSAADSGRPSATASPNRTGDGSGPRILAACPNPVADGDRGEYVVVRLPPPAANRTVTLTDGETNVTLPPPADPANRTVAVSSDPRAARRLASHPVVAGRLALANDGERLRLLVNGTVVDSAQYGSAPEGERWRRGGDPRWLPVGLSDRPVRSFGATNATAFVLPDSPEVPIQTLRGADRRILLAGYTFASRPVARALIAASRRGVDVRVLVEGGPVGGASAREASVLDSLAAAGVDVEVLAGPRDRFSFHHAQYRYLPVHFSPGLSYIIP
ncbi:MAG: phospholipase D-like domain-containing protein [Salinigranum sp.]